MLARSENDLAFFTRRALEEAHAAAAAKSIDVGAAHRQMAAIYAQRLRDKQLIAEGIRDALSDLQHRDLDDMSEVPDGDDAIDDAAIDDNVAAREVPPG